MTSCSTNQNCIDQGFVNGVCDNYRCTTQDLLDFGEAVEDGVKTWVIIVIVILSLIVLGIIACIVCCICGGVYCCKKAMKEDKEGGEKEGKVEMAAVAEEI